MLFRGFKEEKKKDENKELSTNLQQEMSSFKSDFKLIQKLRNKNIVGAYYDKTFNKNENKKESISNNKIRMVSTKPEYTSKYGKSDTRIGLLPNRISYMTPEDKFALKLDYNNKKEIFSDNFNDHSNTNDYQELLESDNIFELDDAENEEEDEDENKDDYENGENKDEDEKLIQVQLNIRRQKENEKYIQELQIQNVQEKNIPVEVSNYEETLNKFIENGQKILQKLFVKSVQENEYEIPRYCYTVWHTKNLPPLMAENYEQLKKQNPNICFHLYDEEDCAKFIEQSFDKEVLTAYEKLSPSSYKSDLWRFCILYIHGGIYLDIKYHTLNNFQLDELCYKEHFVIDRPNTKQNAWWNKDEQGIYTALIVVSPRNKILRQCIYAIIENVETYYYGKNALYPTGPGLLGKKFFGENKGVHLLNSIELFHDENNAIIFNNCKVLDVYDNYRKEQGEYQNNFHYSVLWKQNSIYNVKYTVETKKIHHTKNEYLPNVLCICHIGSYHIFTKMTKYIDNLISARYEEYNLTIYFNVIDSIQKTQLSQLQKKYPNVYFVLSENYGFDIGSFFHILQIVKERNESYDYVLKLHTKTDNEKRDGLLEPILGSNQIIRKIINELNEHKDVGILASKTARCIDAHVDFVRNQQYLQQLLFWYFQEKTNVSKQPYVSGTMFWMRFSIINELFMKINITNIINSLNHTHSFDWNWYYYSNNKYLKNESLHKDRLFEHYQRHGKTLGLSGNLYHAIKYSTNSFQLRDGMIEHAYERFFCYSSHRLGYKLMFVK